jgi:uncharacterized phage-associated protein
MNNIFEVAKAFIQIDDDITHKKLQKLCYYAYSWYLTLHSDRRLFDEKFQAWVHGPVNPELYHRYKRHGWDPIPPTEAPNLERDEYSFIQEIFDAYGHLDGDELEGLTHSELPWIEARRGRSPYEPSRKELNDNTIIDYYRNVFEDGQND